MKKIVTLLAVVAITYLAWSISSSSPENNRLTISGPFEFHGMDMSKNGYIFSRLGITQSLTQLESNGEIAPLLAQSWRRNEQGTRWEFLIREGVKFHDGQPLTAEDVSASLQRALKKPGVFAKVPVAQIEANGQQLVIELTSPYFPLLNTLAHFSLGILSADSFDPEGRIVKLNATGPYQLDNLVVPHKLSAKRFESFWGKSAKIAQLDYVAGHRSESRVLELQSGQSDIAYSIDAISKQNLQSAKNVKVQSVNLPRTIMLKLNNQHPLLSETKVRQAISLAVDRTGIAQSILYAPGSEAYQLFSQAQRAWHIEQPTAKRDVAQAKALLEELGWEENAQGWLERQGQEFALKLTTYADRPELPLIATALQSQLAEIGIRLHVSIDNSSVIPAGHHDNSLQMALVARNFGLTGTPLPLLYQDFSDEKGSDWGHMNWYSPQVQQDLTELISTAAGENQRELSQRVARVLATELPVIPIAYSSQHVAFNQSLQGLHLDPFEIDYRLSELQFHD